MSKIAKRRLLTSLLVGVCIIAVVKLVMEVSAASGGAAGTPAPVAVRAYSRRDVQVASVSPSPVTADDPELHADQLKELDSRPLPDFTRNPFEFAPTPEEIKAQQAADVRAKNPPPAPPPAPPPVPFKAMGYQKDASGQMRAYLSDDQSTYIVRPGQQFGQRFKVLKITNTSVEVEDESYHQIVELPYPQ
jgi:hypothetical protein